MARFVAKLVHDVLEFGVDHRLRHRKVVPRGKLVEQLALHVGAREAVQFLLLLVADEAAQLLEALEPERLGEILVDLALGRRS